MADFKDRRVFCNLLLVFCVAQVLAFLLHIRFFYDHDYLPSPFFYVKSDTFMDLFHLIYWSGDDGRYTEWFSVYPPLVFMIAGAIKAVFLSGIDFHNGFDVRSAGFYIEIFIVFLFLTISYLVTTTSSWNVFSRYEKLLLYLGFILSTPLLFSLERGNVIFIALGLLGLVVSQAGMYRCILIALLINIKPYFVLLTILFVVKNKWSDFLVTVGCAGSIFFVTGLMLDGNFLLFFENILSFSKEEVSSLREIISMPSSISAYAAALDSQIFRDSNMLLFLSNPQTLAYIFELLKWLMIFMTLFALFASNEKSSEAQVLTVLVVLISNLGTSVGGYTLILYYALLPIFWNMYYKWIYLILLGVIFSSVTLNAAIMSMNIGMQYSYLSGNFVTVDWLLDLGSAIKPAVNFVLLFLLSYEIVFKNTIGTTNPKDNK